MNRERRKTKGDFSSRFSAIKFVGFLAKYTSDAHKKCISEIGFGNLLDMKRIKINKALCKALMVNYKLEGNTVEIRGEKIKIGVEDVVDVLGLSSKGREVLKGRTIVKSDIIERVYKIKDSKNVDFSALEFQLEDLNPEYDSVEFKAKFILFAIGCLLAPRSSSTVDSTYINYMDEDMLNGRVNWAKHVYERMRLGIKEMQMASRSYVSGCILILQVIYLDVISGNRKQRGGARPTLPLIHVWGEIEMNNAMKRSNDYGLYDEAAEWKSVEEDEVCERRDWSEGAISEDHVEENSGASEAVPNEEDNTRKEDEEPNWKDLMFQLKDNMKVLLDGIGSVMSDVNTVKSRVEHIEGEQMSMKTCVFEILKFLSERSEGEKCRRGEDISKDERKDDMKDCSFEENGCNAKSTTSSYKRRQFDDDGDVQLPSFDTPNAANERMRKRREEARTNERKGRFCSPAPGNDSKKKNAKEQLKTPWRRPIPRNTNQSNPCGERNGSVGDNEFTTPIRGMHPIKTRTPPSRVYTGREKTKKQRYKDLYEYERYSPPNPSTIEYKTREPGQRKTRKVKGKARSGLKVTSPPQFDLNEKSHEEVQPSNLVEHMETSRPQMSRKTFNINLVKLILSDDFKHRRYNYIVVDYGLEVIDRRQLMSLEPGQLLFDGVIMCAGHYAMVEYEKATGQRNRFVVSEWISRLVLSGREFSGLANTVIQLFNGDPCGCPAGPNIVDRIIIPMHDQNNHWYLMGIFLKEKSIKIFDSLRIRRGYDFRFNQVRQVVNFFVFVFRDERMKHMRTLVSNLSAWPIEYPEGVPTQRNGYDCGMYCIKFIWALMNGACEDYKNVVCSNSDRHNLGGLLITSPYNKVRENVFTACGLSTSSIPAGENWL